MAAGGPLPKSLYDLYQHYKCGTRVVIDWLVSNAGGPQDTVRSTTGNLSVRQILELAKVIATRSKLPPRNIQNAFKIVLVNRKALTRYYESSKLSEHAAQATERHKYFNDTLAQAYTALFSSAVKPVGKGQRSAKPSNPAPAIHENKFEILSGIIEDEADYNESALPTERDIPSATGGHSFSIEDDPLEAFVAQRCYILDMEGAVITLKNIWVSAANGSIPITFAGWITNFGFQMLRNLTQDYGKRTGYHVGLVLDITQYLERRGDAMEKDLARFEFSRFKPDIVGAQTDFAEFSTGFGLGWPIPELDAFHNHRRFDKDLMGTVDRQRIEKYFCTPSQELSTKAASVEWHKNRTFAAFTNNRIVSSNVQTHIKAIRRQIEAPSEQLYDKMMDMRYQQDRDCIRSILRSLHNLTSCVEDLAKLQNPYHIPLLQEVAWSMDRPRPPLQSSTVVGLHILLESGKSFIWNHDGIESDIPNTTNCRARALKLASEVDRSLQELRNLKMDEVTIDSYNREEALAIERLHSTLTQTMSRVSFDLYDQSPWVAGSMMSSILYQAQVVGLELFNEQYIFGGVLHVYNMIRQVGVDCAEVPVLEHLSDLFAKEVFQGPNNRPTRNFLDRWHLFQGGSPHSCPEHGMYVDQPSMRNFSRAFSSKGRFDSVDSSLFVNQVDFEFEGSQQLWALLASDGQTKYYNRKFPSHNTKDRVLNQHSLSELILKVKDLVEPEFKGVLPLAKLNCFKVFITCLDVWKGITRRYCAPGGVPAELEYLSFLHTNHDGHAASGMNLHQLTAEDVDNRMRNKKKAASLPNHSGLIMMRDVILSVFKGKTVEDFLWKEV
ncbi:hypothetical protein BDV95DRAFT_587908 [Massariosphaeria phaeospora]|uniref:DUF6604 domain-containing protein n=1 Tax=Massariosphaeria phaeospora TaxID=100035 RepID=A0A7C8HYD8_9PLEO|nr:hypothetical protein BDV95DRAFT_587908 [Massariosphaeria phaeospora]